MHKFILKLPAAFIVVGAFLFCSLSMAVNANGSDSASAITWRFSHFLPATHALGRSMSDWAARLQEATGNQLKIDVYPAGQLGSGSDQYDIVRTRIAHIAWFVPGYEQGRFPIFSLLETPFLVNDAVAGARSFRQWYGEYSELELGSVFPCLVTTSPPGRLSFKQSPVTRPEQLKGKRLRVSNATVARYVRSLGGVTINIPAGEVRHALERGMIDVLRFDLYSLQAMSLDTVVPNHLDILFASAPAVLGINQRALASLPTHLRETVMDFCTPDWSGRMVSDWQRQEYKTLKVFQTDTTQNFQQVSSEDRSLWLQHTQPLLDDWKEMARRKGLQQPEEARLRLQRILRENNAALNVQDSESNETNAGKGYE